MKAAGRAEQGATLPLNGGGQGGGVSQALQNRMRSALVIEVDSAWHDFADAAVRDIERDAWFESQGYRVVRIRGEEVFEDLTAVTRRIAAAVGCKIETDI